MSTATGAAGAALFAMAATAQAQDAATKKSDVASARKLVAKRAVDSRLQVLGANGFCLVLQGADIAPKDRPIGVTVPNGTRFIHCSVSVWNVSGNVSVHGIAAFAYQSGSTWSLYAGIDCAASPDTEASLCVDFLFLG